MAIKDSANDVYEDFLKPVICNGEECIGNTLWRKISKIEYRFKDSSVPPQWHRSYTITVNKDMIEIIIDSYGDILLKKTYPNCLDAYCSLRDKISKAGMYKHEETSDNGCCGGTTERVLLFSGDSCVFDAYVYHCMGNHGTLYLPKEVPILFKKAIPDNIEDLIESTKQ